MFLDKQLNIRRFNSEMQTHVGVLPHDIGRPITDLTFNLESHKIISQIQSVCKTGNSLSQEIKYKNSNYIFKALAYPDAQNKSAKKTNSYKNGVVISFVRLI